MKLPPYAKPLHELISNNEVPNNDVNIFIGTKSWNKGRPFAATYPTRTCVLPAWHSAFSYYWPVNNCDILVCDTGYADPDYLLELAQCLYEHGANIVRVISPEYKLYIYHKDV